MLTYQISVNLFLFTLGFVGVCTNFHSILISLVGIELMLLSTNMNFLVFSIYLNDSLGQICSIFVLTTAAAESSIGLAILIIAYKTLKSLEMIELTLARQ